MPDIYKHVDLTYLESISEGNSEIVKELIEIFLDQIPEFTQGMRQYFETEDWKSLAALAHKAKSSVLSMGMTHMGEVELKNLELLSKQQYLNDLKSDNSAESLREAEKINTNLTNYYPDRLTWIQKNNSPEAIEEIINSFILQCENASLELKKKKKKLASL